MRTCQRLIQAGADPAFKGLRDQTCLMSAIKGKHYEVIELLMAPTVAAGAIDAQDVHGQTSLMLMASERGMVTLIQKLLTLGADCGLIDEDGSTSLLLAISANHEAAAELLVEPTSQAGAVAAKDSKDRTALMMASEKGMVTLVQKLLTLGILAAGAKPELTDQHGMTALMLACVNSHENTAHVTT